jgi:hypothetical protein
MTSGPDDQQDGDQQGGYQLFHPTTPIIAQDPSSGPFLLM